MVFGMDEKAPCITQGEESLSSTGPVSVLGQSLESSLIPKTALKVDRGAGVFPCSSLVKSKLSSFFLKGHMWGKWPGFSRGKGCLFSTRWAPTSSKRGYGSIYRGEVMPFVTSIRGPPCKG